MKARIKSILIKVLLTLCSVLVLIFIYQNAASSSEYTQLNIILEGSELMLVADVADTREKRIQGLSKRETLLEHEAMLFIFEVPDTYSFHMPDMNFPIDIFWLNEYKEVVFIKEFAHPEDYPEVYVPDSPALYVLETVAGISERYTIQRGDRFVW